MKALILAGGKGTRLGKLTTVLPKPLIKIAGKTILDYQIELLRQHDVKEIVVCINHLGHKIKDHLGNGKKWNVNISYLEETEPLGTAGGVKELADQLHKDFLVVYGDVLLNMDLTRLFGQHVKNRDGDPHCIGTLVTQPHEHPGDSDLVEINEKNKIIKFLSKPHAKNFLYRNIVNIAVYVLSPEICKYIPRGQASDFGKDIFPPVLKKQTHTLYAYNTPEYSKDIGTPKRLRDAKRDVKNGWYEMNVLKVKKPAVFLNSDDVINQSATYFKLISGSALAIKKLNENNFYVVVIVKQSSDNDLEKKVETSLGQVGAKIDKIYLNASVSRMLRQAAEDLNIDFHKSYFVDDSGLDAQTAQDAGIKFVGLNKKNVLAATNNILGK